MSGPKSYRLPNGELVFVYDTRNLHYPPWRIGTIKDGKLGRFVSIFPPMSHRKFKTEAEARAVLREYAEKYGLEPAY